MASTINCPICHQPVDSSLHYCEQCGLNLAIAAVMTEPVFTAVLDMPEGTRIAPEALIPRLGDYLIDKGLLDPSKLQRALDFQADRARAGSPLLIGQALIELGLIDHDALDEVVTKQILHLQQALQLANRDLERRVAERTAELQQALTKLTELNQLKSNFISNISHELRTPLTHIKGYLDLLTELSLGPLTPAQEEALKVLHRAEERLEKLIDDLIQFTLAAKGELSLHMQVFQSRDLLNQVGDQYKSKAQEKQIQLELSTTPDMPKVCADFNKISWALNHLVENAIKFTPIGGCVQIIARHNHKFLNVIVEDNGIGIPSGRLNEIFEPFHQLDGSVTRKYAGTGLGLAMVKRIMDAHAYPIEVHSTVGKGTWIQFSLPVSD